jgi:hypothetical protein
VSLKFSLVDNPRTQIVEWFEDVSAKARGLRVQWDLTGAITLIASDEVWNAIPGNISNPAQVLAGSHPPAYRARPDYDPPAAIDKAPTAVELSAWKLEMDMHFAYTLAQNTLSDALLASVGPVNQNLLKVEFHTTPLHFLTPRQIVDCMFKTHASLTGPDLKKLRAPLSEPLKAMAELELHMSQFMLATIRLTATGHGDDPYRTFEQFLETIAGFAPTDQGYADGVLHNAPYRRQANNHHIVCLPETNGNAPGRPDGLSPVLRWRRDNDPQRP